MSQSYMALKGLNMIKVLLSPYDVIIVIQPLKRPTSARQWDVWFCARDRCEPISAPISDMAGRVMIIYEIRLPFNLVLELWDVVNAANEELDV